MDIDGNGSSSGKLKKTWSSKIEIPSPLYRGYHKYPEPHKLK